MTKDELRNYLDSQVNRFEQVYGGEVVTYAAQPKPDRRAWKKRPNLLDKCSGQLIPDTALSFSSATAGAKPSLN
ncbi:beta-ketoadipyl CoA thiolase [Pseudomonas luteola]|uniref:Beta-ketoadipyl CoA thiolase n=1 Tax=Pseudomonas luteola TaxID=47886 RepID=A0A2X2CZF8_PSELU|nr:hypothetical protein [Pseudomonas luteola]SPZ05345.1 beta-ketoadipyl CoA thiolase [Pseudomonas luteola]